MTGHAVIPPSYQPRELCHATDQHSAVAVSDHVARHQSRARRDTEFTHRCLQMIAFHWQLDPDCCEAPLGLAQLAGNRGTHKQGGTSPYQTERNSAETATTARCICCTGWNRAWPVTNSTDTIAAKHHLVAAPPGIFVQATNTPGTLYKSASVAAAATHWA